MQEVINFVALFIVVATVTWWVVSTHMSVRYLKQDVEGMLELQELLTAAVMKQGEYLDQLTYVLSDECDCWTDCDCEDFDDLEIK